MGNYRLTVTLVLDPAKGLALQSCQLTFRSKQKGSLKVLDYIRENNLFFPKKIEETVESFTSINSLTYNDEFQKRLISPSQHSVYPNPIRIRDSLERLSFGWQCFP